MRAILLDLDGVLRQFPPADPRLMAVAFAPERLQPAIRGACTHEDWLSSIAAEVGAAAVERWSAGPGSVVPEVLDLVRLVRGEGLKVVLVSNATTRLRHDLGRLGLLEELDGVISSAEIGVPKPGLEIFVAALELAGVEPEQAGFVDDDLENVAAAAALGLAAHPFTSAETLRSTLFSWGALVDPVPPVPGLTVQCVRRSDGASFYLHGPLGEQSWRWPGSGALPHDVVHWVVEGHLGLHDGFWGRVARSSVQAVYAELERSKTDPAVRRGMQPLMYAEAVVGVVSWADLQPDPEGVSAAVQVSLDAATMQRLRGAVRGWARRWADIPVGGALAL